MLLHLKAPDFLRLRGAAGLRIEVRAGRVWVTEDGSRRDALLGPGRGYQVRGDGLVLVGAEAQDSEIDLQPKE